MLAIATPTSRPFSGHCCSAPEVRHRGLFTVYLCDVISMQLPGKYLPDSGKTMSGMHLPVSATNTRRWRHRARQRTSLCVLLRKNRALKPWTENGGGAWVWLLLTAGTICTYLRSTCSCWLQPTGTNNGEPKVNALWGHSICQNHPYSTWSQYAFASSLLLTN